MSVTDHAAIITETVLACLKAQGLTVVRIADTTFGSDELDGAFARDVGANAAMSLAGADDDHSECVHPCGLVDCDPDANRDRARAV